MKKVFTIILCVLCMAQAGFSQPRHRPVRPQVTRPPMTPRQRFRMNHPRAFERIRAIKVAYITNRLNFTSEQSANFWPVYNRYEEEVMNKRDEFAQKYANTNPGKADDATSRKYIDDNLDYQQEVLNIRRKYNDEFLKVISPQQVAELYNSEKDFNKMLIQQLNKKRGGGNWKNDDPVNDK